MRNALLWAVLLLGTGYAIDTSRMLTSAIEDPQHVKTHETSTAAGENQKPVSVSDDKAVVKVQFQESTPLSMAWNAGTSYRSSFFVRNDDAVPVTVTFASVLQDNKANVLKAAATIVAGNPQIAASQIENFTVEIDIAQHEAPLAGYFQLVATAGAERKPACQYRAIKIAPASPSSVAAALFEASLVASVAVIVISLAWLLATGIGLFHRMGSPTWTFGDSWGTNIAFGGALLNVLIGFSALPEQTHYMSKIAYLCLSTIFAALIALAPSIYALLRTPVSGTQPPEYQGYVLFFALASGVTVWGALGQLATIGLLFAELADAKAFSQEVLVALVSVLGLVSVLLFLYGCRTVIQIATQQTKLTKEAGGGAAQKLPAWSVL